MACSYCKTAHGFGHEQGCPNAPERGYSAAALLDDIRAEFRKHGWAEHILKTDTLFLDTVRITLNRYDEMQTAIIGIKDAMTTETTPIGAGESSPAPGGSAGPWKFPVNRHDEPRLYPGSTRYEGFAALFTLDDGTEFAILAPTLDALDAAVQEHCIRSGGDPVDRDRCVHVEIKPMPNAQSEPHGPTKKL